MVSRSSVVRVLVLAGLAGAASCSDAGGGYIIKGRSPFLHVAFTCNIEQRDSILSSARSFAQTNGMQFKYSSDEPTLGDFNAWALTPQLNLIAVRVGTLSSEIHIIAVAKGDPAPPDRAEAAAFLKAVRLGCGTPSREHAING